MLIAWATGKPVRILSSLEIGNCVYMRSCHVVKLSGRFIVGCSIKSSRGDAPRVKTTRARVRSCVRCADGNAWWKGDGVPVSGILANKALNKSCIARIAKTSAVHLATT